MDGFCPIFKGIALSIGQLGDWKEDFPLKVGTKADLTIFVA